MTLLQQAIDGIPPKSTILYAVLNWGLGHATRSAVVIRALLEGGHQVVLASDGDARVFLQTVFPDLPYRALPSYKVTYDGPSMVGTMLRQTPKIYKAIRQEHRATRQIVAEESVDYIISDNRYGCYHRSAPSILLTHQLQIVGQPRVLLSMASKVIQRLCRRFDQVWLPDDPKLRLSGILSEAYNGKVQHIGPLSLLQRGAQLSQSIDVTILLSGPEPQRTYLEQLLIPLLANSQYVIHLVRGKINPQTSLLPSSIVSHDYLIAEDLSDVLQRSKLVVCRSGYSSIMDLVQLQLRAILVPTPGQPEQEYLGSYLAKQRSGQFAVVQQDRLTEDLLDIVEQML